MPNAANINAWPSGSEEHVTSALRMLAKILAPFIAAEIGARVANDNDEWIDQHRSPLGRRLHCAAARDGRLTARKVGRRWLARRADVEAFIAEHSKEPSPAAPGAEPHTPRAQDERVRALLAECGADLCPAPSPAKRRTSRRSARARAA